MRDRRPALLRSILRFNVARGLARVATLATLDVVGLFAAIWTALAIRTAIQSPEELHLTFGWAKDVAPLACLVMLLLFARSGLYRDRGQRPGVSRVMA